jgi:hypothetical protein
MKSALLIAAGVLSAATQASAAISVNIKYKKKKKLD